MDLNKAIGIPITIGLITGILTVGVTWGINQSKIATHETRITTNEADLREQRDLMVEMRTLQGVVLSRQSEMSADIKKILNGKDD